ncbi:prolyl 3-hydroxylase OGFOD1 [Tribolium castaneum]|uniref:uS12 prolyl 3-hydroxylase n=1 Tax=Tribolium castaneum TaxID=7070 RepID=D6X1U2_TRICA|nr:PREDICTED: prolyl 3-hydroxylase OGFOD1 [Tribolium castaneum]EFA10164.1 Prolyl 3-hydroxylase sudestada1-like Protein [Tribolium castaneum]|eukprot:XP_001812198.1 PREDICTED: prolyl 3-hydroxylase OGFOD1 [Tribolium castaneum]
MGEEAGAKRKLSASISSDGDEDDFRKLFQFEEEAEEGESDSEPEFDCDKWDNDCRVITLKSAKSVAGYHLMPTCSRDPEENPSKRIKVSPEVRPHLLDTSYKDEFKANWTRNKEFQLDNTELIVQPFKVCVVNNFLENPSFLDEIRQEFNEIDWNVRSLDLYEFFQSKDLKHLTDLPNINLLYKLLQSDVMNWVAEITGLKLTHISATCSFYSNTDYLLVHDDQREDRMVAFILYLTGKNGWLENKGGALQLLNKDNEGQPAEIARNIYPANNQFVFFPVTSDSYHQVAEVTSLEDTRLSINGWFHTDKPSTFTTPKYKPYPDGLFGEKQNPPIEFDSELALWLTEGYLECDIIKEIQEYFEDHSEISLKNFFKVEPFNELKLILTSDLSWVRIGPPNRHCYEVAKIKDLPVVLDRFLMLFQSKQMFDLLKRFTGIEFKASSTVKFELQKWTHGCYSLLGDYDWYEKKQLDLVMHFGCKCNSDVIGGRIMYVTTDEEVQDALITLEPEENNLNIIYRDTARFTKYFSKQSKCDRFYTLICSYTE